MSGYVVSERVMLRKELSVFLSVFSNIVTSKEIAALLVTPPGIEPGFRA